MSQNNNSTSDKVPSSTLFAFKSTAQSITIMMLISLPLGILEFLLPLYITSLGGTPTLIGVLVGIGAVTRIVALLTTAWLIDRGFSRSVLIAGLLLVGTGWLVWANIYNTFGLVLGRIILSFGLICIDVALTWFVAANAQPDQRGRTFGRLTAAGSQGAILGVIVAGGLLLAYDPITQRDALEVIRSLGITLHLPAPSDRLLTFRLVFSVFAGCALAGLLFARQKSNQSYQQSHSLRHSWYTVRKDNAVRQVLLLSLLTSCGYGLSVPMILPLLQARFNTELVGLGIAYAIPGVLYAIAPLILGHYSDRWGYQRAVGYGMLINMLVYLGLPFAPTMVWAGLIWTCEALAYSLYVPALNAWIASILPEQRGAIISLSSLVGALGVSIAAPIGGWLFHNASAWMPFLVSANVFALGAWFMLRYVPRKQAAI